MTDDARGVRALSVDELLERFVENVQLSAATSHIGRKNRIAKQERRILEALKARSEGTLRPLLGLRSHPDPAVQLCAAILCKSPDRDTYEQIVHRLANGRGPLREQARNSLFLDEWFKKHPFTPPKEVQLTETHFWRTGSAMPVGIARRELETRVRDAFSGPLGATIVERIRPAIGVWPRRPGPDISHDWSRLGGLPSVPAGWAWPVHELEPLLFIGQINCAQLRKFTNAASLPRDGVISFFADHDAANGCGGDVAAVFHWPADEPLKLAAEPIEDFPQLPGCNLGFYETFAVPDPMSDQIQELELDQTQRKSYSDLKETARAHGVSDLRFNSFHTAKLFGWPDLVQRDLECLWSLNGESRSQLLLQVGWYENGRETECWGPGGILYYVISDRDLAERRFESARFEMQCP
ncbi:MAG TPA: DUF1963 domain-containing protein [Stellaceae bacterium]|nr:DUF1963 domain-containing protein [Stellaceae bacterium]